VSTSLEVDTRTKYEDDDESGTPSVQVVVLEEDDDDSEEVIIPDPSLISRISLRQSKDANDSGLERIKREERSTTDCISRDVNVDNDAENRHHLPNHSTHKHTSSSDAASCASIPSSSSSKKESKNLVTITNGQNSSSERDSQASSVSLSSLQRKQGEDDVASSQAVGRSSSSSMPSSGSQKVMTTMMMENQTKKINDVLVGKVNSTDECSSAPQRPLNGINNKNKHHHFLNNKNCSSVFSSSHSSVVASSLDSSVHRFQVPKDSFSSPDSTTNHYCEPKKDFFINGGSTTTRSSLRNNDDDKNRICVPVPESPSRNNNVILMNHHHSMEEKDCQDVILARKHDILNQNDDIDRVKNNIISISKNSNLNNRNLNVSSNNSVTLRNNLQSHQQEPLTSSSSLKDKGSPHLNDSVEGSSCHSTSSSRDSVKVEIHVTVNTSSGKVSSSTCSSNTQHHNNPELPSLGSLNAPSCRMMTDVIPTMTSMTSSPPIPHYSTSNHSPPSGTLADLKKHRSDQRRGSDRVSPSDNLLVFPPAMNPVSNSNASFVHQSDSTAKAISGSPQVLMQHQVNGRGDSQYFNNNHVTSNGTLNHHSEPITPGSLSSDTSALIKDQIKGQIKTNASSFLPVPDSPSNTLKKFRGHEVVGGKTSNSSDFSKQGCCTIS
jgi:hypothetical protein